MKPRVQVGGFWLRAALDGLSRVGFDALAYWKKRRLEPPSDNLDITFPYEEVVRLWRAAVQETGNPLIGLHAAESLPVQTPSIFSYLFLSAPNVREGLSLATRFQPLVMNARVSSFDDCGDHFRWTGQLPLEPPSTPQQNEYIVTVMLRMCAFVGGGSSFRALKINFRHAAQGDLKEYERILNCPISFLAPESSVLFDRKSALRPNPFANPMTLKMLIDTAENLLAQRTAENWTARVSAALQPVLADKTCTLDGIARSMHVSSRTLQRNLAAERTTFQDVLDDVRRQRALELVMQPQMTLTTVAQETGFADGRAFNRAFQRWTGRPPSRYREAKMSPSRGRQSPQLRVVGK